MKRYLVPLAVILLVLLGLVYLKKQQERPASIVEQVKLTLLVPEDLTKGAISKLELYAGAKPEEKVVLVRKDGSDQWRVASHFDAPVSENKIKDFLDNLVTLKGEYRAKAQTNEALDTYNLSDNKAFYVAGFEAGSEDPAFRLLVGKAPNWRGVFTRKEDSDIVYVTDVDLRREAGMYGDETDKAPEAGTWLDKMVVELDKDNVTKLALNMPGKELVFEKVAKEPPAPDGEQAAETEKETAEPDTEDPSSEESGSVETGEASKPVEYEWKLSSGGYSSAFKQSGVDSLLTALSSLTASDIVDPAKKEEWGLANPAFKLSVGLIEEAKDKEVVINGARPDASEDGYVQVAGDADGIVYKLAKYRFEQIFPNGAALFELPSLALDKEAVQRTAVQAEDNFVLVKDGTEWKVEEPYADLGTDETTLNAVVNALADWKAADYAGAEADAGLDNPTRRVNVTLRSGETHTLVLGKDVPGYDEVYVRIDDNPAVLAMKRSDVERIFVAPEDLYNRVLLDVTAEEVQSISVERADDAFEVARKDDGWTLTVGDAAFPAKGEAVDELAEMLANLQASDILFGQTQLAEPARATVRFTLEDGAQHVLEIGPEQEDASPVTLSGKANVFEVAKLDADALLPASETLKEEVQEPVPASAPAAETEGPAVEEGEAAAPTEAAEPVPVAPVVVGPAPEAAPPEEEAAFEGEAGGETAVPEVQPAQGEQAETAAPAGSAAPEASVETQAQPDEADASAAEALEAAPVPAGP